MRNDLTKGNLVVLHTEGSGTKRLLDAKEVYEIAEMLRNAVVSDGPYKLYEVQNDGSLSPFPVTREKYLDFITNSAMESLYNVLENFMDDDGNLIVNKGGKTK